MVLLARWKSGRMEQVREDEAIDAVSLRRAPGVGGSPPDEPGFPISSHSWAWSAWGRIAPG